MGTQSREEALFASIQAQVRCKAIAEGR